MYNKANKFSYLSVTLFGLLIFLLLLVACGEAQTPTTMSSTAIPTTQSATSTITNKPEALALEVAGTSEVPLDSAFSAEVSKLLAGTTNLSARLYVSADNAEKLTASFDTAIVAKGYNGLSSKPTKSGETYVGIYTKPGSDDLIVTSLDAPKDPSRLSQGLGLSGLSDNTVNNINKQIKGKNGIAFVFSGRNLVKAVFDAAGTASTSGITPQVEITAPATATPAVTAVTNGPGSELVNMLVATKEVDLKVKKVERYDELKYEGKSIKPKGVFLVISYDFANVSKYPVALNSLNLKDNQDREFETVIDSEVTSALISLSYKSSFVVNPGFVGSEYKVYDVPKEASGFELVPLFETDRKPSAASFASNGGKGPDSGAGAELTGKTITLEDDQTDVKVLSVDRVSAIKDSAHNYKSDGVFLIVTYEMKNKGSKSVTAPLFRLQDGEGRIFTTTDNFDIIFTVVKNSKTKFDDSVNPGQSGVNFKVFEVLKESNNFNLIELG